MSRQFHTLRFRKFRADRSATAAVEFAILSPLYIFLIMGMTAYGIYFGASHSVQQLSADAARAAIAGIDAAERQTLASDFIARNANGYLFIDGEKLSVAVGDNPSVPGQFNVTISYDASSLPIWGLFDSLAMPHRTILRRSTIRIGGI